MKRILKIYRVFILILFILFMLFSSIGMYFFYNFIQPVSYVTKSLGVISEPGELIIEVAAIKSKNILSLDLNEPLGIILISPSGKEYTQSSRDLDVETNDSTMIVNLLTADIGEWYIRYRNMYGVDVSLTRTFLKSRAAMLINTKAVRDSEHKNEYIISMEISNENYSYTIKAVRRSDGFSFTSSGDGDIELKLEAYPYSGVWDFYLNTKSDGATYGTAFSYTF